MLKYDDEDSSQDDSQMPVAHDMQELFCSLHSLTSEVRDLRISVKVLEKENQLCYAVLKEQSWLLKLQHQRLNRLDYR